MEDESVSDDVALNRRLYRVLAGSLTDLPGISSKIVRIFTSSTFTDTTLERNALMENVYPKIKEFCREKHGLEFQVVDMRWGVRDEATDDHMTTDLCMNEIQNCQRLSMGPNFVVFLGQKYGYRPIPTIILASELDMLREVIKEVPSDVEILDTWYKKDLNAVPAVYVLQPISSILTNFNNKRHARLMEQDQNTWWETMGKLQKMLRKAVQVLFVARKLDRDQMHNYFMSVTEREVRHGIINAKNTKDHCLAYLRDIENINLSALRFCRNFIDMVGRDVDQEAAKLLSILRDEILPTKLPEHNIARFKVEWAGKEGIDSESHKEYLRDFCEHFYASITGQVDRAVEQSKKLSNDKIYGEVLQHLHACASFCKTFQGREEVVNKIQEYILGNSSQPLVLYGESGCGKTSLLAKGYSQVETWLGMTASPVLVLRFLGTSPDSSSVIPMLTSLCQQICHNYGVAKEDIPEELSPLVQHLKNLLHVASDTKPLILFLDSLDQLSESDGAHQLAWLPTELPSYTKVVVSTIPSLYNLLPTLKKLISSEKNFVQVTPLGQNLGSTILKSWLHMANRTVSDEQWQVVTEAIEKCNLPLYVKLVFDEIWKWRSYSSPKVTILAHSIHASINKLFDRIENQHGKVLVSRALGYVTAAKGGLSEAELEDLLSLDEKVLNDVYQYHLPPVRRIPPLLWTRIRNDLPHYFSEREADGINVIFWYHRQFIEASKERYFRNVNFVSEVHDEMAEYFLGTWGGGREKPFTYSELQRQRFFLDSTEGKSDRKVPEQPLYFTDDYGKITRYNLRKLSELPYHMMRAHRYEDAYRHVIFNFRFLHAKLSCMPLQAILADMEDSLSFQPDRDVKLLADALRLSASVLSKFPDMLGPQIVGRLLPYYNSHQKIQELIKQCDSDGLEVNALVPSYHCMHTPGGPLQYSLEGHPFAPFGVAITSDSKYLVSVSNVFIIWDLSTGDVFRQIAPGIKGIMQNLALSPDDKLAVGYSNNNQIVLTHIMTGDFKTANDPTNGKLDFIGVSCSCDKIITWTAKEWYLFDTNLQLMEKASLEKDQNTIMYIVPETKSDVRVLIWKTDNPIPGVETEDDMTLEFHNSETDDFYFHSAIAISKDHKTLYACIAISDDALAVYKLDDTLKWKYEKTLGNNKEKVFSLTLSDDEIYLVATVALSFKVWDVRNSKMSLLKLPIGVRNIPQKNPLATQICLSRNSEFLVAGVRKNLYVWDVKAGNLVKTLDAHFGRIISLRSVTSDTMNRVVSSSIDKSIKVWNFDNILEDVHSIDRMEKPIEAVSLATNAYVGAVNTRTCVGVWNLESGKLMKTLANGQHTTIVTHSAITANAMYVVSAESKNIVIWDVETEKVVHQDIQADVVQLMLNDDDTKAIAISKLGPEKGLCKCRSIPAGDQVYQFEFAMLKIHKNAVLTSDGLFLVIPSIGSKSQEVLSLYHAKTGTHMYDMTPKYNNYIDYTHLVAMPNDPNLIALIDPEKGNIWDVKKKSHVKSIMRWNGVCTHNGKFGLYAPNRGGLELLEMRSGKTVHTLIPKVAEGVFTNMTLFTRNDQHAVYYHSGKRSIQVFRVSDGKRIANFKTHAEIRSISSTQGGVSLVLGAVDGSVVVLTVADPTKDANREFLQSLPSRLVTNVGEASTGGYKMANGTSKLSTVVQVARMAARAKTNQKSRACVIS